MPTRKFSKEYQPKNRGRKKGIRDIKSVLEDFLFKKVKWDDIDGKPKKMLVIDGLVAAQIRKAYESGDTQAYKEIMDRYFGKVKDEVEHTGDILLSYGHRKKKE